MRKRKGLNRFSHWDYRILQQTEDYFAVHEVYYDKNDKPTSWTVEPIDFGGDTPNEVRLALAQAVKDCDAPVLVIVGSKLVEYHPRQLDQQ